MLYYVALIWDDTNRESAAAARAHSAKLRRDLHHWRCAVEQAGMEVFCCVDGNSAVDQVYVLPGERGVIFGKVFERRYIDDPQLQAAPPDTVRFDTQRSRRVVESAGSDLVENYWGRYVAFLSCKETGKRLVLRDPTGGVPCQRASVQGVDVYFARVDDLARLRDAPLAINTHFLAGYLLYGGTCVRETGLDEIETVLPGECIEHRRSERKQSFSWDPLEVARRKSVGEFTEAVRLTNRTVRGCVRAWGCSFDGIILSLSGGLDSAIVLSCLDAPALRTRVLCRNFHAPGPSTDERTFARLVAGHFNRELIEEEADRGFSLAPLDNLPRSLFPLAWPLDVAGAKADHQKFASQGISASFVGDGGDELFFRGGSLPGTVDYVWNHGMVPSAFRLAYDDAMLDRTSVWNVLGLALTYGARRRNWHMRMSLPRDHMPLMNREVRDTARRDLTHWHPLYRDPRNIPPGKLEHAYLMTFGSGSAYAPLDTGNSIVHVAPLLSQPIFELSLSIPLSVLRHGGRDRAVARRAFAADLPDRIVRRQSKSIGNSTVQEILLANIGLVRELLLDGYLVREGLLDRAKLGEVLSGRVSAIQSEVPELCSYLAVESWARGWLSERRRAIA